MTNQHNLTSAQLADLDQRLAEYDLAVNGFINDTAHQIDVDGKAVATAAIADSLANQLDENQLASVAAIALVRLADRQITDAGRTAIAEDVRFERTQDAASGQDRP